MKVVIVCEYYVEILNFDDVTSFLSYIAEEEELLSEWNPSFTVPFREFKKILLSREEVPSREGVSSKERTPSLNYIGRKGVYAILTEEFTFLIVEFCYTHGVDYEILPNEERLLSLSPSLKSVSEIEEGVYHFSFTNFSVISKISGKEFIQRMLKN